jgi:hypothetical protein
MVAEFQHGLVRLDTLLIALVLIATGLGFAAIWMRLGTAVKRRVYDSIGLGAFAAVAIFACAFCAVSWDASESRGNSFPESDELALRQIKAPLRIVVHLAPEDPRRFDLEHHALSKLRRVMPRVQVQYVSATSIGMFEQTNPHYGEIWYYLDGRKTVSRIVTAEGVLEAIYSIANVAPPVENDEEIFRGHPLAVAPNGAGAVFYGVWPGLIVLGGILLRRRLG